jgi:hypothetical protein
MLLTPNVICMLHVCYMFEQHITWLNPFVQRQLSHIMLYGYMFLRVPVIRLL